MRRSQHTPKAHPEGEKHFRAARVGNVAEVNNVAGLPAEPFAEPVGDFAFGRRVGNVACARGDLSDKSSIRITRNGFNRIMRGGFAHR